MATAASYMFLSGVASIAIAAAAPMPALAQNQTYNFDIPSQELDGALREFAAATNRQIAFDKAVVRGHPSPGVKGQFSAPDALRQLLGGTNLDIANGQSGVFIIRAATPIRAKIGFTPAQDAPVVSQTAPAPEPEQDADILVTGSRIARAMLTDSPVPIVAISERDIEASGSRELSEVLADYPAVTPGLNLANSTNQINGSGTSTISLRSLGTNRTLTLIDGRRAVTNSATSNAVSLSSIPSFFVERVDIVTGGASAIYGSDAIAGVINVITRNKFDGVRLGARYGVAAEGDTPRANIYGLAGASFFDDRVSVMIGAEYEKEYGLFGRERPRFLESLSYSQSADANPLNQGDLGITRPNLSSSPPGGRFGSSSTAGGGYFYYDTDNVLRQSASSAIYGIDTRPNLQVSARRESRLVAGKINVELSDRLNFFAQVQFSDVDTQTARGGADTASSTEVFGVTDERIVGGIPRTNPFVPAAIRARFPTTSSTPIPFQRRFTELGDYEIVNDRDTWRGWAGLNGQFGKDWKWEVSYGYGRFRQDQTRTGLINFENLQFALDAEFDPLAPGDITRVRCRNTVARAAGCVPINLFGRGAVTPAMAEYIGTTLDTETVVRQDVFQGFASGSLFTLPAGPVGFAFGGEYRKDRQFTVTDPVTRINAGSASFIAEYTGQITSKETFAELNIPLLADRPFFHRLGIDAAIRYGDYSIANVGSVLSYRAGGEYAPVDGFRIRGQWARAQRAPTVTNLFSPARDDADTVADLCDGIRATTAGTIATNCRAIASVAAVIARDGVFVQEDDGIAGPSSGNPDLREETADTITLGAVFTPRFAPGLSATVDYFDIKIKDAISSLDGDDIIRECLANPAGITDNFFCGEITRDSDGQITRILNRDLNLNEITRRGIDFAIDYRFDAPRFLSSSGRFDARILYSRLLKFTTSFNGIDGERTISSKGEIGAWENQGQAQLGYREDGFSLRWKARYTGKAVDSLERLAIAEAAGSSPPFLRVGERIRHDFYASFDVKDGGRDFRFYTGINNAFNSVSPFLPSGTDTGSSQNIVGEYDVIGRYVYFGAQVTF